MKHWTVYLSGASGQHELSAWDNAEDANEEAERQSFIRQTSDSQNPKERHAVENATSVCVSYLGVNSVTIPLRYR